MRAGIAGVVETDMMRWFDPSTNSFTFRGETFDLQALAKVVSELLPLSIGVEQRLQEEMKNEVLAMHNGLPKPTPQGDGS